MGPHSNGRGNLGLFNLIFFSPRKMRIRGPWFFRVPDLHPMPHPHPDEGGAWPGPGYVYIIRMAEIGGALK